MKVVIYDILYNDASVLQANTLWKILLLRSALHKQTAIICMNAEPALFTEHYRVAFNLPSDYLAILLQIVHGSVVSWMGIWKDAHAHTLAATKWFLKVSVAAGGGHIYADPCHRTTQPLCVDLGECMYNIPIWNQVYKHKNVPLTTVTNIKKHHCCDI